MSNLKKIVRSKNAVLVSLAVVFVLVLLMNHFTIWAADDYANYNSTWQQGDSFDILKPFNYAKRLYFGLTGRFLSSLINGVLLYFNKTVFDILNSFVYAVLVFVMYQIIKKEEEENALLLFLIFIATWFFIPALGQVVFWQTGSVIYLWMFTLGMCFILAYINLTRHKCRITDNIINNHMLFFTAILVGNGLETNSLMFFVFLSSMLFFHRIIKKHKLPKWAISGYIGLIVGTLTNVIAPGNFNRLKSSGIQGSLFEKIYYGMGLWFYRGVMRSGVYLLLILFVISLIIYLISKHNVKKYLMNRFVVVSFLGMIGFAAALLLIVIKTVEPTAPEFLAWYWPNITKFNVSAIFLFLIFYSAIICIINFRKNVFAEVDLAKDEFELMLCLSLSACIGIGSYIIASFAWERSYMGMCVFLITAIIYLLNRASMPKKLLKFSMVFSVAIVGIFCFSYYHTIKDAIAAKQWENETKQMIYEKIANNETAIKVKTFMSSNPRNAASVEKWVIPAIVDVDPKTENNIHVDYEWINIQVTNYFFKDPGAWGGGKRILGVE